jgi:hypothetical protein
MNRRSRISQPFATALAALSAIGTLALAFWLAGPTVGATSASPAALMPRAYLPLLADHQDLRPANPTAPPSPNPSDTPVPTATKIPTATPEPTEPGPKIPGVPHCRRTTGDTGGFRFSKDGGRTLAPNSAQLARVAYTWDINVDPRNPDVVLELHDKVLYRSTDAGCTFRSLQQFYVDWDTITRAPSAPDTLVLTSVFESGFVLSTDGGTTWADEETLPDDVIAFDIAPEDPWHWTYAARNAALYERKARDQRWEALSVPLPTDTTITAAAAAPSKPGRWLVGSSGAGLYASDDNGKTWAMASGGLSDPIGQPPVPVSAIVVASVAFAPSDANVAYAALNQVGGITSDTSARGIWRTGDFGAHWIQRVHDNQPVGDRTAQLTGATRVFVAPDDANVALFAFGATANGYGTDLFRSVDGLTTLDVAHFDDFYEIFALAFGPPGSDVRFVGVSSDITSY